MIFSTFKYVFLLCFVPNNQNLAHEPNQKSHCCWVSMVIMLLCDYITAVPYSQYAWMHVMFQATWYDEKKSLIHGCFHSLSPINETTRPLTFMARFFAQTCHFLEITRFIKSYMQHHAGRENTGFSPKASDIDDFLHNSDLMCKLLHNPTHVFNLTHMYLPFSYIWYVRDNNTLQRLQHLHSHVKSATQ